MIDHDRCLELAAAAVDFDLSPSEQADLTEHLAACGDCRRAAADVQADARALRRLSAGAPTERVRARVLDAAPRRRTSPLVIVAAAAAIVVAALGGLAAGAAIDTTRLASVPTEPAWSRLVADDGFPAGTGTSAVLGVAAVSDLGSVNLVAVGRGAGDGRVWTSGDGRTWSLVAGATGLDRANPVAVAAVGAQLVTVGTRVDLAGGATAAAWLSRDARTWTRHDFTESTGLLAVAGSPARIVVGGAGRAGGGLPIWSSPDGASWVRGVQSTPYTTATVTGIAVGGPGFVAVGYDDRGAVAWTSTDAAVWTRVDHASFVDSKMTAVATTPAGLVAVGFDAHGPISWSSLDGRDWSRGDSFATIDARAKAVAATKFGIIAVGYAPGGARAWASQDGQTWQPLWDTSWAGSCDITSIVARGTLVFAGGSAADKAGVWVGRPPAPTS